MKTEKMTKKQYTAPDLALAACSAEDIISTSFVLYDEGDGEWLNWADMNRAE